MQASLQRGEATLAKWMEGEGEAWGSGWGVFGGGALIENKQGLTLRFPIVGGGTRHFKMVNTHGWQEVSG